jgi:Uma2 family endonuclease
MTAARKLDLVSVDDYLEGELSSPIKHEYLGGVVHAMAGARNLHNRISTNILGRLFIRLDGRPCQPWNSDTKVRIELATQTRFYYPDCFVVCRENPDGDSYQDEPVVIFEVLSKRTWRIDTGEKKDAYLTIPSLHVYAMVEQETAAVVVYRRSGQTFLREVYEGRNSVLPLTEIGIELPLSEIYGNLELIPEADDDEEV